MKHVRLGPLLLSALMCAALAGSAFAMVGDEVDVVACPDETETVVGTESTEVGETTDGTTDGDTTCPEESTDDGTTDDGTTTDGAPESADGTEEPVTDDTEEAGDDTHGAIVSMVAKCAPKGAEAKALGVTHGSFVKAAAHGDTYAHDGTDYDLSTLAGAQALCDALAAAAEEAGDEVADGDEEEATSAARQWRRPKPAKDEDESTSDARQWKRPKK